MVKDLTRHPIPIEIAPKQRQEIGRLTLTVHALPTGAIEIDQHTDFTTWNQSAEASLTEVEKQHLVELRDASCKSAGDFFAYYLAMAVSHGWRPVQ